MANSQDIKEPEVVMTYHGRCTIDFGEHGHQDVELHKLIAQGTQLITLAAYREAIAEVTRRFEELKKHGVSYHVHNEAIAKKDAALKVCVEALEMIMEFPNTGPASTACSAAITQGKEAL